MQYRYHQAMTLVEMLIAIGVFAVGVLAVLQIVINNIHTTHQVSQRMDATMLATQWLELIYELRNTNSYKEVERDCLHITTQLNNNETACEKTIGDDISTTVIISPTGPKYNTYWSLYTKTLSEDPLDDYRLYRHISEDHITYFTHKKGNGEPTAYARYLSFEKIDGYDPSVALKVNSHVLIDQWSNDPTEIIISSVIGNIIE